MDECTEGSAGGGRWHCGRADLGSVPLLVPQQRPGEGCVTWVCNIYRNGINA